MSKWGLEKEEESEIKLPTISGSWRKQGKTSFLKNTYLCFIDYTKAFGCVDHNKLWRTLKEMEIPVFTVSWETSMQVQKQQLEPCMEQLTGSGLRRNTTRLFIVTLFV